MKSFNPARWPRIKLFAMDVDGVLTDGTVSIFSDGTESKSFSIQDGLGLRRLMHAGLHVAWISGRHSEATAVRAAELEISHLFQAAGEKQDSLRLLAEQLDLSPDQVCFMGDDLVDLKAMEWAGVAVAVPNAAPEVLAAADYVAQRTGGSGAVREICDLLLQDRNS
jgi:3-deoxy-D-manno-octulosonate 8-phosphate phosphatase (KDO 8-P phosphatase)